MSDSAAALLYIAGSFDSIELGELLGYLLEDEPSATFESTRDGLARLAAAGLLTANGSQVVATKTAQRIVGPLRRLTFATAIARAAEAIDAHDGPAAAEPIALDNATWAEAVATVADNETAKLHMRRSILAALVDSLHRIDDVNRVIRQSRTRGDAVVALTAPPFGYSEFAAQHVLDMPLGRQTEQSRELIESELASIDAKLAEC